MKKMSRRDKSKQKYTFFGESYRKGIFMRLQVCEENQEEKTFAACDFPGAFALKMDDGTIKVDPDNVEEILNIEESKKQTELKKIRKLSVIFRIIAIISVLSVLPSMFLFEYLWRIFMASSVLFYGFSLKPAVAIDIAKRILHKDEYMQLCRFHAAEHAAINAYYDLERAPTIEEIKKYSIFSYDCGILEATKSIWIYVGTGICLLFSGIWYVIAWAIFLIFSYYALKKELFFTEAPWLAKPTDFEYDTAIKVMNAAIKKKEELEEKMGGDVLSVMAKESEKWVSEFAAEIETPTQEEDD